MGRDQTDHRQARPVVGHEAKTVLESGRTLLFVFRASFFTRRQRKQRNDQGHERDRISKKCRGRSPGADENPADGRTDDPGTVKDRTIDRDAGRNLFAFYQFGDERGERRHFERIRNPENRGESQNVPDRDLAAPDEITDSDREGDLHELGDEQDFALVVFVRRRTAGHRQRQHRQSRRQISHAEPDRFRRQRAHDVTLRHDLHPGTGIGNRRADDVTAVGRIAQYAQRAPRR